jgi:endonuclease/exonuclease/phosphatase family metal-dependent hydrolase
MEHVKKTNSGGTQNLRVTTYNIHKCRGMDGRVRPERIVKVLREVNADIIALQEVVGAHGKSRRGDQVRYIAEALGFHCELGENRRHKGGAYGNVLLTRFPIKSKFNYDITVRGYERRGCLRTDLSLDETRVLHVFNVHMGTSFFERRHQARKLIDAQVLNHENLSGMRLMLGDFNEWTRGLASRLLSTHFRSADVRAFLKRPRTYPGVLPLMHLDNIYFDPGLELRSLTLHRSRAALLASDHLPLVAEFDLVVTKENPDATNNPYCLLSYPETSRIKKFLQSRNHRVVRERAGVSLSSNPR